MRNVTKKTAANGGIAYLIRVSAGYDAAGRQIKRSITWKPAAGMSQKAIDKELERQAVMFEEKVKKGYALDSGVKFGEYAARWMGVKKSEFAPITYVRYETLLVRINQAIGHIKLSKLQPMHLQEFYKDLGKVISERTHKPLAPQTIRHYHRLISAILAQATKERLTERNIASREYMDAPKVTKKEPVHLDIEQARRFIAALAAESDMRIRTALTLLIYSGCRVGELSGLEWQDIDHDRQIIFIRRTSQYCKGQGVITKTPKNTI